MSEKLKTNVKNKKRYEDESSSDSFSDQSENFYCNTCKKYFINDKALAKHYNKKIPCEISTMCKNRVCHICDLEFESVYGTRRHINNFHADYVAKCVEKNKNCTISKNSDKSFSVGSVNGNENIIGNNNVKTVNNITININNSTPLLAFGHENIDKIPDETFKEIFTKGNKSIIDLVSKVHFDENIPENHNVYISNLRGSTANVFDGDKWIVENSKSIVCRIISNVQECLENKRSEFGAMYKNFNPKRFDAFTRNDYACYEKDHHREIKNILYSKRSIPMKTREKNEKCHKMSLELEDLISSILCFSKESNLSINTICKIANTKSHEK